MSTFKLHCAAKTAKFFLARKLPAKRCKNMQNMLKATQTMRQLLQTTQVQNNVLHTKSQNMHLHTRAQNRGSNRNQIFTGKALKHCQWAPFCLAGSSYWRKTFRPVLEVEPLPWPLIAPCHCQIWKWLAPPPLILAAPLCWTFHLAL